MKLSMLVRLIREAVFGKDNRKPIAKAIEKLEDKHDDRIDEMTFQPVPTSNFVYKNQNVTKLASISAFPAKGLYGKLYVALDTGKTYRWTGSEYAEMLVIRFRHDYEH